MLMALLSAYSTRGDDVVMRSQFAIDFVSDFDLDYLAVEITFRKQRICRLTRRIGDDLIEMEILDDRLVLGTKIPLKFALVEFLNFVEDGRVELMKLER